MEQSQKTILLVEDEAIQAMVQKRSLQREGFNVIHVPAGEDAITTVEMASEPIDIILMDIDLGYGMDGTEAAEQILLRHDIPLLFLSSHTDPEIVNRTESISSYGYVVKGSSNTVLLASMKMAFKLFDVKQKLKSREEELTRQKEYYEQKFIHLNSVWKKRRDNYRRKTGKQLRKGNIKFRQLVENIGDGIGIVDAEENFIFANRSAEAIFNAGPGELTGRNLTEFISADEKERILRQTEQRRKGVKSIYEMTLELKDGGRKTIQVTATPRFDEQGEYIGTFGNFRDITEKKNAEIQLKNNAGELKELNEAKDRLFSIISHDLRGPFSGFMGLTETLAREADEMSREDIKQNAAVMHETAKKVYNLLSNLLIWSRLQMGKVKYRPSELIIYYEAESVLNLFSTAAGAKGITLSNEMSKEDIVFADPDMIATIFRNLISNAIKFTGNGGSIRLWSEEIPGYINLVVEDNGVGMTIEEMDKIFRLASGFSTRGTNGEEGTGLGLILCREMAQRNGGHIKVDSMPARGTRFTITLPETG